MKNLIADSGNIFATERPFPVQNAITPPSAYIRETALPINFVPPFIAEGVGVAGRASVARVIRNILSLSKGAVHVRETVAGIRCDGMKCSRTHRHQRRRLRIRT